MKQQTNFLSSILVLSLASACLPARAESLAELISPDVADVSVKLPWQGDVSPLYRQYQGVNRSGVSGNVGVDIVKRSDKGDWFKLRAQDLGLSTQELGVAVEKQGDWSLGLDYNQIPRYAPYQVGTNVSGAGTATITQPTLGAGTFDANGKFAKSPVLQDVTLRTERNITTITASKFLQEGFKASFSFKNEDKTGTRMDGVRGIAAGAPINNTKNIYAGFLFAPEPINQNHKQFDATLDFETPDYQWTAGFYGSMLQNRNDALTVMGSTNTAVYAASGAALSPIALPPDNSLQQFYVSGGYNFSKDTRATLKFSQSDGRQNAAFIARPSGDTALASTGSSLDGSVRLSETYASLSSRINRDLKLFASWRHEETTDKTAKRLVAGTTYFNSPESHKADWGKINADYHFGGGYSLTAGLDSAAKKSAEWERQKVEELTQRVALRKTMGESVNGTLTLSHSDRTGSDWTVAALTQYPVFLADRSRNTVRGLIDWTPEEKLNLQFSFERYLDRYTRSNYGLDSGRGQVFSVDGSYTLSESWKFNSWYSRQTGASRQNMLGAVCSTGNNNTCTSNTYTNRTEPDYTQWLPWNATLTQNSDQFGLGIEGRSGIVEMGMQYLYSRDLNRQTISDLPATTATARAGAPGAYTYTQTAVHPGAGVLPDTRYTLNSLRLHAIYPYSKKTKLRMDAVYDLRKMDDYTWRNWVYADGTQVYVAPKQTTRIIAFTLIHSF